MIEANLEGVESLRIIRAQGNLTLRGTDAKSIGIDCDTYPEVHRADGVAELNLQSNGELRIPAGVAVEIVDCSGNLDAEQIPAPFLAGHVRGNFHARAMGPLKISSGISGNLTLDGAHSLEAEKVSGNARISGVEKTVRIETVAGNLEVISAESVAARTVAGKARISDLSGVIRIDTVGGRLKAENVGGDIEVDQVGGHARIVFARGGLELPRVGGAIDLMGPFPAGQSWRARCRGRASVELDPDASIELSASAGWGRIRLYGADTSNLRWIGRNRVEGRVGVDRPETERLKLSLETGGADVIVIGPGAATYDFFSRARRGFGGRMGWPFEEFAENVGAEIPDLVSNIMGAVGKFVGEAGSFSGGGARDVASDLNRELHEVLREFDLTFARLRDTAPREVADKVAKLGREVADAIAKAIREGRCGTREERDKMREQVREAVREMRDTIRTAAREARARAGTAAPPPREAPPRPEPQSHPAPGATVPLDKESRDREILEILKAVKEGRIDPEEADDMISAWMEVRE